MSGTWRRQGLVTFILLTGILVTMWSGRSVAAGIAMPVTLARADERLTPVRLCTSVPVGNPGLRNAATGINDAVGLASERWTVRFRRARLEILPPLLLDDGNLTGPDASLERQNAQRCAGRSDTLGYIGPLNSGMAPYSMPVLNRAGMAQISPGNTVPTLTSPVTRKGLQPATYHHVRAYPTYYRTITTDAMQGPAAAAYSKARLHAATYFLINDQGQYGSGIAGAIKSYAGKIGLKLLGTGYLEMRNRSTFASSMNAVATVVAARHPDGVLFGGDTPAPFGPSISFFRKLRQAGYTGPLVGPDSTVSDPASAYTSRGERNLFGTIPGPAPEAWASAFRKAYARRFHTPLEPFTAPAYDAANIMLNAVYQAAMHGLLRGGLHKRRVAILPYVARTRWHGATGTTTFDANGDTTNQIVSMYRVRKGAWHFVGVAPQVKGVSPTG